MVTSWKSFSFFVLFVIVLVSGADGWWQRKHRDDLCDVYDESWSCDTAEIFRQGNDRDAQSIPLDDKEQCELDLVGTTLALMNEGDEKIELTDSEEAIFLIGNTGTGKSTLTYFLAGNNSALIAYYVDDYNKLIKDCNGKIGDSTIVSQTIFPDLVVEAVTNSAFYDNPGFQDTRTPCIEIANAYFITKVVNHVKRVKFVVAVNHQSVTPLADRGEFVRSLKNVFSFIPNLQKFLPSVALIGTKAKSEGLPIAGKVKQMSQFFTKNQDALLLEFPDSSTMVFNLITTLNETDEYGNFTRMNVFRVPEECGPLSGIEVMQQNRDDIMYIIEKKLNYTDSLSSDFGVSLSSDANLTIQEMSRELSSKVVESFEQFANELLEYFLPQFESQCSPASGSGSGCDLLISDLETLFSNPDFAQDYSDESSWAGLNFTGVINQVIDPIYFPSEFDLSSNLSESFEKYGRYLEFLNGLQPLLIDIPKWFVPLKSFKSTLTQNIRQVATKWNDGTIDLIQTLSTNLIDFLKGQLVPEPDNFNFEPLVLSLQALFSNPDFQSNYNDNDPSVWKDLTFSQIVARILNPTYLPPLFETPKDVATGLQNSGRYLDEFQKYIAEPPLDLPLVLWIEPLSNFKGQLLKDLTSSSEYVDSKMVEALSQFSSSVIQHFKGESGFDCLESMNCGYLTSSLDRITTNPDFLNDYTDPIWPLLSFTQVVTRLSNKEFLPENYTVPIESFQILGEGSDYLDFLKGLSTSGSESLVNVEIGQWLKLMRELRTSLLESVEEFQITVREAAYQRSNQTVDLIYTFTENLQGFLEVELNPEDFVFQPIILSIESLFSNPDFQSNYNDNNPSVWKDLTFSQIVVRILNPSHLPPLFEIPEDVRTGLLDCGTYLDEFQKYAAEPPLDLPLVSWIEPLSNFKNELLNNLTSASGYVDSKMAEAVGQFSSSIIQHLEGDSGFQCLELSNCVYLTGSLDRISTSPDFLNNYTDPIWPRLSFTEVVTRLTDSTVLPQNYTVPSESFLILERGSYFLDHLRGLSEYLVNVDIYQWLERMKGFRTSLLESLKVFEETVIDQMDRSFNTAEGQCHSFFTSLISSDDATVILGLKETLVSNYNDLTEISTLDTDQQVNPGCQKFVKKFIDIANKNGARISQSIVSTLIFQAQVFDSLQKYPHVHSLEHRKEWIGGFITIVNSIDPALVNAVTCDSVSSPAVFHGFFVSLNSSEFRTCFTAAQNNAGSAGSGILISALHTVFLDSSIKSTDLNVGVISPNWVISGTTSSIDLTGATGQDFPDSAANGKDGRPGYPGLPGRNFYGLGRNSVASGTGSSLKILAHGGKGGKGENGGGSGGFNGEDPDMNKVKVELSSDYSPRFVDSPYFAQNLVHHIHGMCCKESSYMTGTTCRCANFQIKGAEGQVGSISRAGDGGKYGKGGLGGTIQVVKIDQTGTCTTKKGSPLAALENIVITTPTSGANGIGGAGGMGSGKNGAIIDFIAYKTTSTSTTTVTGLKTFRKASTSVIENGQSDKNEVGWVNPSKSTIDISLLTTKFKAVASAQVKHTLFGEYISNFLTCVE